MAINKKLLNFATKANFSTRLANNEIDDKSIIFIKDTGEIWTHGKYYGGMYGTADTQKVPLTIGGISKNISLDGHTHNQYVDLSSVQSVYGIKYFRGNVGINNTIAGFGSYGGLQMIGNGSDIIPSITFHQPGIRVAQIAVTNSDGYFRFTKDDGENYTGLIASAFAKYGGTSSQFLKADGSVDSNAYWHTSNHPTTLNGYGITDTINFLGNIDPAYSHVFNSAGVQFGWNRTGGSGEFDIITQGGSQNVYLVGYILSDGTLTEKYRIDSSSITYNGKTVYDTGNFNPDSKANTSGTYSGLSVGAINNDSAYMKFHWDEHYGQPAFLWGSNDPYDIYVFNPANLNVAYATSAGNSDTVDGYHAASFIRTNGTINNNIDSDYGEGFVTFDPTPTGTPPNSSANIRTINIGNNFVRRTQLAFNYESDHAYFRRNDGSWNTWKEFIHSGNIGSQSVSNAALFNNIEPVRFIRQQYLSISTGVNIDDYKQQMSFAYTSSGAPVNGGFISFGGLDGWYDTQIIGNYLNANGNLLFRTRNGDAKVWNDWKELYHTGNANLSTVDWNAKNGVFSNAIFVGNSDSAGVIALQRASANYIWANQADGYLLFVTNGLSPSAANASFYASPDKTVTFNSYISATTAIFSNLTANYIPKHTASGLVNSLLQDSGTNLLATTSDATIGFWLNSTGGGNIMSFNSNAALVAGIENDGTFTNYGAIHSNGNGNNYFAGNVGVGTTAPQGKLDILNVDTTAGDIYFTANVSGTNQNSNSPRLNFVGQFQSAGYAIQAVNTDAYGRKALVFYGHNSNDYTTYQENVRFTCDGKVLIGTMSDAGYKLDVNGTFRATGAAYLNSTLNVGSTVRTTGVFSAGEGQDDSYGYVNVCRTASINNASCFSWVREGNIAFGLGFNTSNQIVIGQAGTDKTITPWLTISGGTTSVYADFYVPGALYSGNRIFTGYDSGVANSISCSGWFRSNNATGWFNATYGAGIQSDTNNVVRTYSTNKFFVYNTESDSIKSEGGITSANLSTGTIIATGNVTAASFIGDVTSSGIIQGNQLVTLNGTCYNYISSTRSSENAQLTIKGGNYTHVVNFMDSYNTSSYAILSGGYQNEAKLILNSYSAQNTISSTSTFGALNSTISGNLNANSIAVTTNLTVIGNITANNITATNLWGIASKDISLTLTTDWQDTGILFNDSTLFDAGTGTYVIELYTNTPGVNSQYQMRYSGILAVFSEATNNSVDTDEITLHSMGHANNGKYIYLRTALQITPNYAKLQIASSATWTGAGTITIKTRRII